MRIQIRLNLNSHKEGNFKTWFADKKTSKHLFKSHQINLDNSLKDKSLNLTHVKVYWMARRKKIIFPMVFRRSSVFMDLKKCGGIERIET